MKTRLAAIALIIASSHARSEDWPQWLGPGRDAVWKDDNVLTSIPAEGLSTSWKTPVGLGYSGPAVSNGKVYLMDYVLESGSIANDAANRDFLTGVERILCLDSSSGEVLWVHGYDRNYSVSYGGGPRCTPLIEGGKVFALGAEGDLICLNSNTGKLIWNVNLRDGYADETPEWGFSAHPLLYGDLLYCMVGKNDNVVVAFDKNTGEERWSALNASGPGYCPPTLIDHEGKKQILIWHPEALCGLNPFTGEKIWSLNLKPAWGMSVASPRKFGPYIFATGIGNMSVMAKLGPPSNPIQEIWRGNAKNSLHCSTTTPLIFDGVIYGCDSKGQLIAADLMTGDRYWSTGVPVTGADGRPQTVLLS